MGVIGMMLQVFLLGGGIALGGKDSSSLDSQEILISWLENNPHITG